jgi:mannose-binding lectin 2
LPLTFQPVASRDWEIHLHFSIHGSGDTLFGDGFALFYARDKMETGKYSYTIHHIFFIYFYQDILLQLLTYKCLYAGPVFGSRDFFSGLGIFFDTYSNQNGEHAVSFFL